MLTAVSIATLIASRSFIAWFRAEDVWELYDVDEEFSQTNHLAAQNPAKLSRPSEGCSRFAPALGSGRPALAGSSRSFTRCLRLRPEGQ